MIINDKFMIIVDCGGIIIRNLLAEMRYEVRICIKYALQKFTKILKY